MAPRERQASPRGVAVVDWAARPAVDPGYDPQAVGFTAIAEVLGRINGRKAGAVSRLRRDRRADPCLIWQMTSSKAG